MTIYLWWSGNPGAQPLWDESSADLITACPTDNDRTLTLTMMVDCRAAFHRERLA
jgi:hypothetical protein